MRNWQAALRLHHTRTNGIATTEQRVFFVLHCSFLKPVKRVYVQVYNKIHHADAIKRALI
jgi:hypothetical protein